MRKNTFLFGVLLALILFLAGFLCGKKEQRPGEVITQIDTLILTDTICVEKPVFLEKRVVDTMVVTVTEFQVVHDTAFVTLPREEVEYRDTSYRAVVSGFLPRLEELEIYQKERVVTIQTEKVVTVPDKRRWGAGVQAGYGITPAGFQPYLGVGVSFTLVRW